MGSTISTLAFHAVRANMTHETMIGVLLAMPYFLAFFKENFDKHVLNNGKSGSNSSSIIRLMSGTTSKQLHTIQEDSTVVTLRGHRSLVRGTMPAAPGLVPSSSDYSCPSSQDSVETVLVGNTPTAIRERTVYDNNMTVQIMPQVVHIEHHSAAAMEDSEEYRLGLDDDDDSPTTPTVSSKNKTKNSLLTIETCSTASTAASSTEVTTTTTPTSSSRTLPVSPLPSPVTKRVVDHIPNPSETITDDDNNDIADFKSAVAEPPPTTTTSHYLETVSKSLARKALHRDADHANKVGISQALMELADILLNQDEYRKAMKVLKRAEVVQKLIVEETMHATASAMAQQSQYYKKKKGHEKLARIYGNMAKELSVASKKSTTSTGPSPVTLKRAIGVHQEHRVSSRTTMSKELASLTKKLDRRIQRVSAEAAPLGKILTKQALCSAAAAGTK